jgi:hypothetical protein
MASSCRSFVPKMGGGPLRRWCYNCNLHEDAHLEPSGDRPKGTGTYPSLPVASQSSQYGAAVAVFDFDQTLAAIHVGIFDVNSSDRVFGGAARTQMIVSMLAALRAAGSDVHVVTRNSVHVCRKALGPPPGINVLGLLGSILGREDYGWTTPKSAVRIATHYHMHALVPRQCHPADSGVKGLAPRGPEVTELKNRLSADDLFSTDDPADTW